jgi:hypothetical protein
MIMEMKPLLSTLMNFVPMIQTFTIKSLLANQGFYLNLNHFFGN